MARFCRFLAALAVLLLPLPAWAYSCPALPYTLTNGSIADASQVMADFNDLLGCFPGALTGYTGATSTGTANAQAVSYTSGPSTYATGTIYSFVVGSGLTNTGPATVNINTLGAKAVQIDGQPLVGGEMVAGTSVSLMYDGTNLQLLASPGARTPVPNILLNPSMEIDQANEGASVNLTSGVASYIVDGWVGSLVTSSGAAVSCQRVADAPPGFIDSLKCTTGTGASSVGAGDYDFIVQRIEANDITSLGFGTTSPQNLCVSFWLKSSISPYTFGLSLIQPNGSRSWVQNIPVSSAATWTPESVCLQADGGGTWTTSGTSGGLNIRIVATAGSNFQTTGGSWQATANGMLATSSITNTVLTTTGAYYEITGVKLEASPLPTPYVRLPISQELMRAQRYYQKSYDLGTALGTATVTGSLAYPSIYSTTVYNGASVPLKTTMRCDPSITIYNTNTGTPGSANFTNGNIPIPLSIANIGTNNFFWQYSGAWSPGYWIVFQFAADCRL